MDSIAVDGAIYGTIYPAIYGTINCSKNRLEHKGTRGVGVGAVLFLLKTIISKNTLPDNEQVGSRELRPEPPVQWIPIN